MHRLCTNQEQFANQDKTAPLKLVLCCLFCVATCRQPACHLSGRFLPPSLLEVPSQLFERLFTSPTTLAQLCLHHHTAQTLPQHLANALASYYKQRYASALALSARAAAGLAEQIFGQYGDEAGGCGIWRGSWELLSGLPGDVAAAGSLREVRNADRPALQLCSEVLVSYCDASHVLGAGTWCSIGLGTVSSSVWAVWGRGKGLWHLAWLLGIAEWAALGMLLLLGAYKR
jgi:hypothetical protein